MRDLNHMQVAFTKENYRLQFMTCGLSQTSVPTSIHCDHLIQAVDGAESDLKACPVCFP